MRVKPRAASSVEPLLFPFLRTYEPDESATREGEDGILSTSRNYKEPNGVRDVSIRFFITC